MHKTVVINAVGLTPSLLGPHTPRLNAFAKAGKLATIGSVLPGVTCSVQATYLTGTWPAEHGIVGNGWYLRDECEIKFWRQSNHLVQRPKIWELARTRDPSFTCANLFWWYNMYSSADISVTPRPMYPADGRKLPDIYTEPSDLRFSLQKELGQFPLFQFWGPGAGIKSTQWIADAALRIDRQYNPTLTLIYLPHLDYALQRHGPEQLAAGSGQSAVGPGVSASGGTGVPPVSEAPVSRGTGAPPVSSSPSRSTPGEASGSGDCPRAGGGEGSSLNPEPRALNPSLEFPPAIAQALQELDAVCGQLIDHYTAQGARILILSEYGITPVSRPVHINRMLRQRGLLAVREELGRELLDPGASAAFAVSDHQVAHVYVNDRTRLPQVRALLEGLEGVAQVLDEQGKHEARLDHPRSGELIAIAAPDAWFTYYYWLDDAHAPDFARTVDIHRKPGYDPVELFIDPQLRFPKLRIARRLLQKTLGFRYLMDVIGMDATLVRGSHGRPAPSAAQGPMLMTQQPQLLASSDIPPTDVFGLILRHLEA